MNKIKLVLLVLCAVSAQAATSVTQHGITWTFNGDYTVGQYCNGDYYVVAPSGLTITSITPASTLVSGRTINGSMINPSPTPDHLSPETQGFDSAMYAQYGPAYSASLNVARPGGNDLSAGNPLVITPTKTLVSSISATEASATSGVRPQINDYAVLTVVSSAPAAGSFRPQLFGTTKTETWNKSALNYSILQSLASVTGTPALSTVTNVFNTPWWVGYFHIGSFIQNTGSLRSPSGSSGMYGRETAVAVANGLLSLHLNYSNAQKEALYIALVQLGIDVYGIVRYCGVSVQDNAGILNGLKAPMVLAAVALDDAGMKAWSDAAQHKVFSEDLQTWTVTNSDVGRSVSYTGDGFTRSTYITADIGLAEAGQFHTRMSTADGRDWHDMPYRDIIGSSYVGNALGIKLLTGGESAWGWAPFFNYSARYMANPINDLGSPVAAYHQNMWTAYSGSSGGGATLSVGSLTLIGSIQTQ